MPGRAPSPLSGCEPSRLSNRGPSQPLPSRRPSQPDRLPSRGPSQASRKPSQRPIAEDAVFASALPPEPKPAAKPLQLMEESLLTQLPADLAQKVRRYQQKAAAAHQALQQRERSLQLMEHAAAVVAIRLGQKQPEPVRAFALSNSEERSLGVKRSVQSLLALCSARDARGLAVGEYAQMVQPSKLPSSESEKSSTAARLFRSLR